MRRLLPMLIVAALGVAAPTAALAAPDFLPPTDYPLPLGVGGAPAIGFADGGQATAAWVQLVQLSPVQTILHVAARPVGGAFTDQMTVPSSAAGVPTDVQLAVAPDGAAVIAWAELTTNDLTAPGRYRAAYRPAGSNAWQAPITLATDTATSSEVPPQLFVAIGPDGSAAAGVSHLEPNGPSEPAPQQVDARLDVAVRPPSGPWGAATRVSPVDASASSPAMAFDGAGNLTIAWGQRYSEGSTASTNDDRYTLMVRRRSASNGIYDTAQDVTQASPLSSTPGAVLAVGADGRAVLAYQDVTGGTLDLWASLRPSTNGTWTPAPGLHVTTGAAAGPMAAGVAPDGSAYVEYWYEGTGSAQDCVGAVRAPAGATTFSPPTCISPLGETAYSGGIGFAGSDAIMAWATQDSQIQAARWAAGAATPDDFRDLDMPTGTVGFGSAVADGQGGVGVFWSTGSKLRVAAYDAGPPQALALTIPASGVAGAPLTMAASFADLWSDLGAPPSWTFGDGATASGASVSHAYAAPGTYAVTVRAHDALGNERVESGTVTVSAATTAGTPAVSGPPVTVAANQDRTKPTVTLTLPTCAKRLAHAACTLTGKVADNAAGPLRVELGAVLKAKGKKVLALAAVKLRRLTPTAASRSFVRAKVKGGKWTLKLPRLPKGTWTLRVRATDAAGNVSRLVSRSIRVR